MSNRRGDFFLFTLLADSYRGHRQDHRVAAPLLHHGLEPVRLRAGDRLHRRHRDGGPHGGLPRVAHAAARRAGLQDRQNPAPHPGELSTLSHCEMEIR